MNIYNKYISLLVIALIYISPYDAYSTDRIVQLQSSNRPSYVADELLIKFKQSVTKTQQSQVNAMLGAKVIHRFGKQQRFHRIKFKQDQSMQQMLTAYRADPSVEHVQPNYIYYAQATMPDDNLYNQLWGLNNSSGNDIDAELAWDHVTDCSSVIVAVIDGGIDYTHQDLADNMWDGSAKGFPNHGFDFVGESIFNPTTDVDPLPMGSIEDHGTHVAGTIAAVGNNNNGITGVCWQAQIMAVRVLDSVGFGLTSSIIQGIEFAIEHGAKVINMSLGFQGAFDQAFSVTLDEAKAHDVVVVVAAGNAGIDNDLSGFYPCNFSHDNLLCVTALDRDYNLAPFSNFGLTHVDIGAPGVDILSNIPAGWTISDPLRLAVTDPLNGWNTNNGRWSVDLCDYSVGPLNTLVNPSSWCNQTGTYVANADDRIYKTFDLSDNSDHALLFYQPFIDTQSGFDVFSSAYDDADGDPFIDPLKTMLEYSGKNDSDDIYFIHDLTACRTSSCTIGFRLTSDADTQLSGIGIPLLVISTLKNAGNTYDIFSGGTSMAAPHVAGVAALVRAYNPDYTYADTVAAIKQGGEYLSVLDGFTSTSNAVNAMGSLSFINPPTGVAANVQ